MLSKVLTKIFSAIFQLHRIQQLLAQDDATAAFCLRCHDHQDVGLLRAIPAD